MKASTQEAPKEKSTRKQSLRAIESIANEMHTVAHSFCTPTRKALDVWAHDILEHCSHKGN